MKNYSLYELSAFIAAAIAAAIIIVAVAMVLNYFWKFL